MDTAAKIRGRRAIARLTQGELGERTETSRASVARYEDGSGSPTVAWLRLAAAAMECSLGDLIGDEPQGAA